MDRIRIDNARIIDPHTGNDGAGSLCIQDGKIIAADKMDKPDYVLNADGMWVCPGIIDLIAYLSKPGEDFKASFINEAEAAVSSGITAICCPPDTSPMIDNPAAVELVMETAREAGLVRVYPIGALTSRLGGETLSEMYTLKKTGCIAVSNAAISISNNEVLRRAMEYAASTDLTVFYHPEDRSLRNNGTVNEGEVSTRLGLPPIPDTAETVAVSTALLLSEQTGARIHFTSLTTSRSVELVRQAKQGGLPVTAGVDICHLYLTEMDVDGYNANCHLVSPLRTLEDKNSLIEGVRDGTIDAVCSAHQPISLDSKAVPFSLTLPGASTLELLLPLMIDLISRNKIEPATGLGLITSNPAEIISMPLGRLSPGSIADVIVIDPDKNWTVKSSDLKSNGKCTPFDDWQMQGQVTHTIVNGKIVYQQKQ